MSKTLTTLALLAVLGAGCQGPTTNQQTATPEPIVEAPKISVEARDVKTDKMQGFYVFPAERTGKLPGVLVMHEWWGLNDYIKDEAKKLAAEGYAVFAIDLYDGEVATTSARAGELAGAVRAHPDAALVKMRAALDYLAEQPEVDGQKLASFGWCFGGGFSALVGTADPRLKATVMYYGTPITDAAQMSRMKQPVLGIWGEEDQSIPIASVKTFESALKEQGTPAEFHYYAGAGHAFANPTRGEAYKPEATADAWSKTLDFLARNLK